MNSFHIKFWKALKCEYSPLIYLITIYILWNPDWYLYPNYVFNGFPESLSMDSINNNLKFKINEDLKSHPYTNISVTVPLGENFYTSAFSFTNEINVKSIDVIIIKDSLSTKSIKATYVLYGNASANSLAGVFGLKDRSFLTLMEARIRNLTSFSLRCTPVLAIPINL